MNYKLTHITARSIKPREAGLTMVMDKGMSIRQAEDMIDACGPLVDLVKIGFGTNCDADPRLVCKLAIEIASAAPRAIKSKPPNCILTEFAEAGMKFSLTFWIADPDGMDNVKSEVMLSLWDAFKREGIKVPYPVREIRIRGGALPVETTVEVPNG